MSASLAWRCAACRRRMETGEVIAVNDNITSASEDIEARMARPVAPEDLRPGDYVAALQVVNEHLWPMFGSDEKPPRMFRVLAWPGHDWMPMQVEDICLPFVMLKTPRGKHWVLDTRQCRLGRVSASFGRRLFEAIAAAEEREKATTPADTAPSSE